MNYFKNLTLVIIALYTTCSFGQLTVDAEVRPRFEYRHGFKTLFPDNTDPAAFVSQRTRLNAGYTLENLEFYLSFQDVRVWGDVSQLNTADKNGLAVHQAWAKFNLDNKLALKVGRQEIIYDDSRIMGNVGWAQQARSHDAAVFKVKGESTKLDVGFAFNQDGEALTGTTLTTPKTYKAIQYAWFNKKWTDFSASFLFLNNGMQYIDLDDADNNETRYSQTVGTHLKYKKGKFALSSNLYYQFGKDVNDNSLSAYLLALDANYKASNTLNLIGGVELLSGNDDGAPANGDNNAFTPFYGTNHKFNGLMDYFYVGNHANNVGLLDIYLKSKFKLNEKSSLLLALHNFSTAADYSEKNLGNELDIVYNYKIQKNVKLTAGYSHLFPGDGMEVLKGNTDGNTNNWGWVMLTINPTLFKSSND